MNKPKYNVIIKSYNDPAYQNVVTEHPVSEREADELARAMNVNLDHAEYYVVVKIDSNRNGGEV